MLVAIATLAFGGFTQVRAEDKPTYKVVWSHYAGWEPWAYAESSGILAQNAKKYGVNLTLELINDYGESINRYVADPKVIALTITEMDALTGPCVGGVDTTAIVVGDYSNGNDGIVAKNAKSIRDIKGRTMMLVENSVSHYLLYRGLTMNNLAITDVKTKNVSDADVASVFTAAPDDAACVTWNPPLMTVRQVKGATEVFDSSKIPGEILDLLVVKTDAPEAVKKALAATWYDVMKIMYGHGTNTEESLNFMAKSSGCTRAEYDQQLKTTFMFNDPAKGAVFAKDAKLKQTLDYVRKFCFDRGLYNGAASPDSVGIALPDGSTIGSKNNVKLRFDNTYMEAAAAGKL
jgi:NitT/TauT family transport system substrate-binding protein